MFRKIMVPVDLAHADRLTRALETAAALARLWDASVTYVGVTAAAPGPLGHTPKEYGARLAAFAEEQGAAHGFAASAHPVVSHDPTTDVDDALIRAVEETGADLVVMASHIPNVADYVWPSNAGKVVGHVDCSVMVVRPE